MEDDPQALLAEFESDELIRPAKAIAALVGITDETLLKRYWQSRYILGGPSDPMPIWQDGERGQWCAYRRQFLAWWLRQRKTPRPRAADHSNA